MDAAEIDRLLEQLAGPPPAKPRVSVRSFDEVLASRTHVRVLRVIAADGDRTNLTARDVARRAEASHGRVLEVLRHLSGLAIVDMDVVPTHSIYRLNEEHPLVGAIRRLFEEERRAATRTSP